MQCAAFVRKADCVAVRRPYARQQWRCFRYPAKDRDVDFTTVELLLNALHQRLGRFSVGLAYEPFVDQSERSASETGHIKVADPWPEGQTGDSTCQHADAFVVFPNAENARADDVGLMPADK